MRWHEGAEPALGPALWTVARRIRLGARPELAIRALARELGRDAESLSLLFVINRDCGGDLAALIEVLAAAVDQRAKDRSVARASAAGAILSSRMVAALPLLCVPLMPMSHAPMFDPIGLAMLVTGVALSVVGLGWIRHLMPAPPESDDPVAVAADVVAAIVSAGIGLRQALDHVAERVPREIGEAFTSAARRVALGSTWPESLAVSSDGKIAALGRALLTAHRLGVPVAGSVRLFASELRHAETLAFETRTRKAPVVMVLPLVLCILPSFLLLGLGPFIRGLSVT